MAKIVVAEDDKVSRSIIVSVIESMGHTAIQSSDGLRAFYVIQDNPDSKMLITDMEMPNLSGRELLVKLKACKNCSRVPVLVISGAIGPKAIDELLTAGAVAFLGKPINAYLLREYIAENLEA